MLSSFVALAHATAESASTIARGWWYISMVISMILSAMKYKRVVDCLKWSCPAGATWKNLQRMAVLTLSLSRYHPPSLLPVLPLVNMPVHSNSFEIRPNCIQTLWSFEFILIGVSGLWRRLQFTDSKLLTLVSQETLVMCIHQRKWTALWGCLARHGLPLVYLLPHDIDIFWCQRCNESWQGFFLLPWFSHVGFDHPFNVPGRSFVGYGRRAGRNWNWTYKLYIYTIHIYIIYLCVWCIHAIDWHWLALILIAIDRVHWTHVATAFSTSFHLSTWIKIIQY